MKQVVLTLLLILMVAPVRQALADRVIFEDPGKFIMVEGGACGQGGGGEIISIPGSMQLPADFESGAATVVLNGWRLGYLNGDHKVQSVRANITEPRLVGGSIQWDAVGVIHDDTGFFDLGEAIDDPYEFCYRYVAFAWDRGDIHAIPGPQLQGVIDNDDDNRPRSTTALATGSFVRENPWSKPLINNGIVHRPGREGGAAILPQGFQIGWGDFFDVSEDGFDGLRAYLGVYDGSDNHLLQIAYNKGASASYQRLNENQSSASPLHISWDTAAIIKDNKTRRDFTMREHTVVLGGRDVQVIDPPFSVLPREDNEGLVDATGCIGGVDVETKVVDVEDIAFDYAVPMLTGWELSYGCEEDENVLRMGLWLQDISFEKDPDTGMGRLRYSVSSQLRDADLNPPHTSRYKVSILGLRNGGPYRVLGSGGPGVGLGGPGFALVK